MVLARLFIELRECIWIKIKIDRTGGLYEKSASSKRRKDNILLKYIYKFMHILKSNNEGKWKSNLEKGRDKPSLRRPHRRRQPLRQSQLTGRNRSSGVWRKGLLPRLCHPHSSGRDDCHFVLARTPWASADELRHVLLGMRIAETTFLQQFSCQHESDPEFFVDPMATISLR